MSGSFKSSVESGPSLEVVGRVHLCDGVERRAHLPPDVPRAVGVLQGDASRARGDGVAPRQRDGRHRARRQDGQLGRRLHRVTDDQHLLHLREGQNTTDILSSKNTQFYWNVAL